MKDMGRPLRIPPKRPKTNHMDYNCFPIYTRENHDICKYEILPVLSLLSNHSNINAFTLRLKPQI